MPFPEVLFPHDSPRPIQNELIRDIAAAIKTKTPLVVHAPTGLGKTAAALGPAVAAALQNNLTVFFLTSRHTQHELVNLTVKKIKQKFNLSLLAASIIGKKWMCAQQGAATMLNHDFTEYCKNLREHDQCEYFTNAHKLSTSSKVVLEQLQKQSPLSAEHLVASCSNEKLCPYEMSLKIAKQATVIITDYFYLFAPVIREKFMSKIDKQLETSIIIVDEGHNLPSRIRDMMTSQLSNMQIARAIKEAKKYGLDETIVLLVDLQDALNKLSEPIFNTQEVLVSKEQFVKEITASRPYDELVAILEFSTEVVYEHQPHSSIAAILRFLQSWNCPDEGFARILKRLDPSITLFNKCMDPASVAQEVVQKARTTILMSGTLSPTLMFRDLLGFPAKTILQEYPSPFPSKNKLVLIVPETTTKYTARNDKQFENIGKHVASMLNSTPGSSAVFFPSYYLRDAVYKTIEPLVSKTFFVEQPNTAKEEKQQFIDKFKKYKQAVLLGAASGSFGEGVDLPGLLDSVIIVGLPLDKPDLETQQLIAYYDKKFSKGWEYGYILPALTKTFQNAGRCIRTETDRGVIVFLDERYIQPQYRKSFPADWNVSVTKNYAEQMKAFFG
ncbi:MAG: ATP-dependent DNA helicase [Candidatus Aenigmarchaeota archaeon]|nr:ATP-dependent DNA helicase [Candidatus Aenigmarchaeota archaeon]